MKIVIVKSDIFKTIKINRDDIYIKIDLKMQEIIIPI